MNKVKLFSRLEVILAIVSILLSASFFVLLEFGVIQMTEEGSEFGEGIAAALAVIFFVLFTIGQATLCIYMIIEGIVVGKSAYQKPLPKKLLIIGGIIKLIFITVVAFLGILFLSMKVWFCGISAFFFAVILLLLAVFGFIVAKESI